METPSYSAGIHEIVLVVKGVLRAATFYRDVVGLTQLYEPNDEWAGFATASKDNPQWLGLRNGTLLYEQHSPRPEGQRFGPIHYALQARPGSLGAFLDNARHHGLTVYGPEKWEGRMKGESYYFYDLDDNLVEYWFPEAECKIKAIREVAFKVRDLDQMHAFYENLIGLQLMRRFPTSAFFKVAAGQAGHTQILALFRRDENPPDGHHSTVDHIAFSIDLADFEPERARLEALGLHVKTAEHCWVQWRSLYVRDPEGNNVELVCFDPAIPVEL
ncbi:MAG: VOC family protein [Fimbriimonadales bacterium]